MTDPHDGKSIGIRPPLVWADIVLISHDHFDHNCSRIVKGDFAVLQGQVDTTLKGVSIKSIQAFHDEARGEKRGSVYLFRFEMDGLSLCHLGDLGHMLTAEQEEFLRGVDIMFIPVGGVFTIDGIQAKSIVDLIRPKVAVPMHYRMGGLSLSIQTVDKFLKDVPENQLLRVGNEVDILPEDLPETTEIWVFSP